MARNPKSALARRLKKTTTRRRNEIHPKSSDWTQEQLSDPNFLKVPANVWHRLHKSIKETELMSASVFTWDKLVKLIYGILLPDQLAGGPAPIPWMNLSKTRKWIWDKSAQTDTPEDTYRYRILDNNDSRQICPEFEEWDPVDDDETLIKVLFYGVVLHKNTYLIMRRICPDSTMPPMRSEDEWRHHLNPSVFNGLIEVHKCSRDFRMESSLYTVAQSYEETSRAQSKRQQFWGSLRGGLLADGA
ncbi:hypothetical protein MMC28_010740 [Mycoblastus sanguinarius]|nr:hypothetical protein [Mycoblastus sanguinarius]